MGANDKPPVWGDDSLTEFLECAEKNSYATFVSTPMFEKLKSIDNLFVKARGALDNYGKNLSVPSFFLMALSSYRGAVRLAISGQNPEAYMVMRGCIERALYGMHILHHPELTEVWISRGSDKASRDAVRKNFTHRAVIQTLQNVDRSLSATIELLYERTIDHGAHPNAEAYLTNAEYISEADKLSFEIIMLNPNSNAFRLCLKTTAQVGISCLYVFNHIFGSRFELLGVLDKIKAIGQDL